MENSQQYLNSAYLAACIMTTSFTSVVISYSNVGQQNNKLLLSCLFFELRDFPCSKNFSVETTYIFLSVSFLGEKKMGKWICFCIYLIFQISMKKINAHIFKAFLCTKHLLLPRAHNCLYSILLKGALLQRFLGIRERFFPGSPWLPKSAKAQVP